VGIRILESPPDCEPLAAAWNRLVERAGSGILGLDATATFDWALTLWEQRLANRPVRLLVWDDDQGVAGLLPLFTETRRSHGLQRRILAPITELYSNRCGFVVREPGEGTVEALLGHLFGSLPDWDLFTATVVEGSASEERLKRICARLGHAVERVSTQRSPYFELRGSWDDYFAALPKKFRWTLRSSEKRMRTEADLVHREVTAEPDLEHFLQAMLEIERGSWKENAGTSLSANEQQEQFHRAFARRACERGWFLGQLLELGGEPIAYIYGLLFKGVFHDFKESFKEARRDLSPGHVLKMLALERLYGRGVEAYDFMGVAEPYKLRWADREYTRSTYRVYNRTLAGQSSRWAASGTRLVRSVLRR
jgi:CelD/BcsL family acetyltransferase involved in cellulose biosynthesis